MANQTVQEVIDSARNLIDDGPGDHFSTDDVSFQVTATNQRFKLTNQNIVQIAEGAPVDLEVYVDGAIVVVTSVDQAKGVVVLDAAPAEGSKVTAEYYFVLIEDAVYLDFVKETSTFLGFIPTFTLPIGEVPFPLIYRDAANKYTACLAAKKMSNLTSWYYQSNSANKSFNKDTIASKFREMSKDLCLDAEKSRNDVSTRHGQREAPATSLGRLVPMPIYTPRR